MFSVSFDTKELRGIANTTNDHEAKRGQRGQAQRGQMDQGHQLHQLPGHQLGQGRQLGRGHRFRGHQPQVRRVLLA